VKLGDINKGETMTMAPIVVKGKVLVGNSGAEFGARGWITALNASDGSIAWRAYSTGPDKDVLIDPLVFKPFYDQYKGKDLGVSQWPADGWKIGGGTVWGWISYDPDLDLIFHGTSNPSPWNHEVRPGDNHWTNGLFAREPATGKARWFYQFSPHDLWDHSAVNENIVLDLEWNGSTRKVVVRPERNGYMYVIDRTNGQVLAADPFVHITASKGVDPKTGRLIHAPEKVPTTGKGHAGGVPQFAGSARLEPVGVQQADRPHLQPGESPLHGLGADRGRLHCRNSLPRRRGAVLSRQGRACRRAVRLGPGEAQEGLRDPGALAGVERRGGDRRRHRVLRQRRGLVQSR